MEDQGLNRDTFPTLVAHDWRPARPQCAHNPYDRRTCETADPSRVTPTQPTALMIGDQTRVTPSHPRSLMIGDRHHGPGPFRS